MAEIGSNSSSASGLPAEPVATKRVHSYSRLTTALAVLALATAVYVLFRLDSTRDRVDEGNQIARTLQAENTTLRTELKNLRERERQARRELERRLDEVNELPKQVQELGVLVEELRGRATGPERAWSRAEALFLLELAQRRLTLDRDVETAIVALESADARLASLRDTSFTAVRQQIAKDLLSLRAVRRPDVTGILARLAGTEEQAMRMSVKGIVVVERTTALQPTVPQGVFTRAWNIATATVRNLVTVRKVDDQAASVVTAEEQLLRRQHLQLLLFSARTAVARHDAAGYRSALARARQWIGEFFDLADPAVQSLLAEVQALEPINVDPQLPDVSTSLRLLQKLMPVRSGPE